MKWIQSVGLCVCVLGLMVGCGGDEDASEAQACTPGVTQECACPDQYQECKEDGSGFTSCDCPEESGDESSDEQGGESVVSTKRIRVELTWDTPNDTDPTDQGRHLVHGGCALLERPWLWDLLR